MIGIQTCGRYVICSPEMLKLYEGTDLSFTLRLPGEPEAFLRCSPGEKKGHLQLDYVCYDGFDVPKVIAKVIPLSVYEKQMLNTPKEITL